MPDCTVHPFQRVGFGRLEADVQVQQLLAHLGPQVEVVVQRQARELSQEIDLVVVSVHWIVQDSVGVGEYLFGGDSVRVDVVEVLAPPLAVVVVDVLYGPIGDVADALAVVGVAVEGEALGFLKHDPVEVSRFVLLPMP